MSLVGITSPRSSPGATSLAVGLAMAWQDWGLSPLLVEADPAGGVLGHRFNITGSRANRTLLSFAVDSRRGFTGQALANNVQQIAGFEALLAPLDPARANQAVDRSAQSLIEHSEENERPIIADLGRIQPGSPALKLARACDMVLVVLEPQIDQVQSSLFQLASLRQQGLIPELVLVGTGEFDPADIAASSDASIAAVLPKSPKTAAALSGGTYRRGAFNRSPLWRSISALARGVADTIITSPTSPMAPPTAAPAPPTAPPTGPPAAPAPPTAPPPPPTPTALPDEVWAQPAAPEVQDEEPALKVWVPTPEETIDD